MITIDNNYPVFEANQVLSQKQLNELVSYLEEQDRVSRTHLLGMGIVCGLEIYRPADNTLKISCGTGITSLGYMVSLEDTTYTHYRVTNLSETFLNPDLETQKYLSAVYDYSGLYLPFKDCFELLETDANVDGMVELSPDFFGNKIVMLLHEVSLVDLKNCDVTDCADKGKSLQFKTRPLIIDINDLNNSGIGRNTCTPYFFKKIGLPKYNVPRTHLVHGAEVLEQFNVLIAEVRPSLFNAINSVHLRYGEQFGSLFNYGSLAIAGRIIDGVHNDNRQNIYLQYVWDWIADLVATYHEIAEFIECNPSLCCPDKGKFPFHLLLGSAQFATAQISSNNVLHEYRTTFIKTGVFSEEEENKKQQLKGLLEKLIHQLNHFHLNTPVVDDKGIKITPSVCGDYALSQKSIPYYYGEVGELNTKWSPIKTLKKRNDQILSYHSGVYNAVDRHITNPQEYDTEPFNFFRIEGHIGRKYEEALAEIISQKEAHRLPFKVIALNAMGIIDKIIDISKHTGDWGDLELDYDIARTQYENSITHLIEWAEKAKEASLKDVPSVETLNRDLSPYRGIFPDNLQDFLVDFKNISKLSQALKKIIVLVRFTVLKRDGNVPKGLEDFIDHLDTVKNVLVEDSFSVLYNDARLKWNTLAKELFLSHFLEQHPGIDHKAGVPKGGTFILIYQDASIFRKTTKDILRVDQIPFSFPLGTSTTTFQDPLVEEVDTQQAIDITENFVLNPNAGEGNPECSEEVEKVKGEVLENLQILIDKNLSFGQHSYFLDLFHHAIKPDIPQVDTKFVIPDKVVLADFYLPYICCGKGNNINIVFEPDTPEPIVADFDGKDFEKADFFTNDQ